VFNRLRQDDGRLCTIPGVAAFDASREIHAGDLAQQHRLVLPIRNDRVPQVVEPPVHTDIADQIFAALLIDETAARIDAEARDRRLELVVAHIEKMHRDRVRHDAVLTNLAADRDDLGNARNGQELRAQHEIGDLAHVHGRDRIACHRDQHDLAHDRGDGAHLRRNSARELLPHERQPFRDQLAIAEDICAPVEFDVDDRKTDTRHRPHPRHAGHSVHDALDRERDELFDLLRRQTSGFGHQRHDRAIQIRKDVNGNAWKHKRPINDGTQRDREDDQPVRSRSRLRPSRRRCRPGSRRRTCNSDNPPLSKHRSAA
jgi:hypothetical protein